jgi:NhaP-type Na+/H+ or K+/H+ antiporter
MSCWTSSVDPQPVPAGRPTRGADATDTEGLGSCGLIADVEGDVTFGRAQLVEELGTQLAGGFGVGELGVTILVCAGVARRVGAAPPVPMLLAGVLLGFLPALRAAHLPPEAVLLLFLPVLLYWEGFISSIRQIRRDLRVIVLMSTVLVVLTAAGAAATAHALGMPWGPAWVLGAAIAPTDATAVGVLGRVLPRRIGTMLRAESLVNDGTALVLYALAVGVTVGGEHFSLGRLGLSFLLSYGGGVAIGLAVTYVAPTNLSSHTHASHAGRAEG